MKFLLIYVLAMLTMAGFFALGAWSNVPDHQMFSDPREWIALFLGAGCLAVICTFASERA